MVSTCLRIGSQGSQVELTRFRGVSLAVREGRPGVHPHWLFHFPVSELEAAVHQVRAAGRVVLGPFTLPGGERVAVCEDGQGAAFGLRASS